MRAATKKLGRIKKRSDFVAASKAQRFSVHSLTVESRCRGQNDADEGPRLGYTVTKRVGNAVERNRIKRRLRAAIAHSSDVLQTDRDYAVIARRRCLTEPFEILCHQLRSALEKVTEAPIGAPRKNRSKKRGTRPKINRPSEHALKSKKRDTE